MQKGTKVKKDDPSASGWSTMYALNGLLARTTGIRGGPKSEEAQASPDVREQRTIQAQLDEFRQLYNDAG